MSHPPEPSPDLLAGAIDAPQIEQLRDRLQQHLPDYRLLTCLGRGGMGAVFRAHHLRLDRPVAIKALLPAPDAAQGWEERFLREAQALARLAHPGIVGVYDFGQSDDLCWIVMEYVDGASLRDLMKDGRLRPEEALSIVPQICEALQFAHDRGVVHRDVKPENVLLDEGGRVRIADFGLAKLLDAGQTMALTGTEQAMGTLRYMAPEQLERPKEVDHRADIFSLGIVLYEMLTGQVPIGAVQPPSAQGCTDPRLDEVVMRSMERAPEERFQRAEDVGERLEELRQGAAPPPAPVRAPRSGTGAGAAVDTSGKRRARLRGVSIAMAAVGLLSAAGTWGRDPYYRVPGGGIGTMERLIPGYDTGLGLLVAVILLGIILILATIGDHRGGRTAAGLQACLGPVVSFFSLAAYSMDYDLDPSNAPMPFAAAGVGGVLCVMGLLQIFLREPGEESVAVEWNRGMETARTVGGTSLSWSVTALRSDLLWRLVVAVLALVGLWEVNDAWDYRDFFDEGLIDTVRGFDHQSWGLLLHLAMAAALLVSLFGGVVLGVLVPLTVGIGTVLLLEWRLHEGAFLFPSRRAGVEIAGWTLIVGGFLRWIVPKRGQGEASE